MTNQPEPAAEYNRKVALQAIEENSILRNKLAMSEAETQRLRTQLEAAFSALAGRMTQEARSTDAEALAKGVERLVEERDQWKYAKEALDLAVTEVQQERDALRDGLERLIKAGQWVRSYSAKRDKEFEEALSNAVALLAPAAQEAPPEPTATLPGPPAR